MTNTTLTFNSPFPSVFAILSSRRGTNSSATIGSSWIGVFGSSSSSSFFFFFFRLNLIGFPSNTRDKSSTPSASSSYSESSPLSVFLPSRQYLNRVKIFGQISQRKENITRINHEIKKNKKESKRKMSVLKTHSRSLLKRWVSLLRQETIFFKKIWKLRPRPQ